MRRAGDVEHRFWALSLRPDHGDASGDGDECDRKDRQFHRPSIRPASHPSRPTIAALASHNPASKIGVLRKLRRFDRVLFLEILTAHAFELRAGGEPHDVAATLFGVDERPAIEQKDERLGPERRAAPDMRSRPGRGEGCWT